MSTLNAGSSAKSIAWLSVLACFSVLNETVFNVALPDIAEQFGIMPSTANWVNTSFMLSFAIGSAVYGKLSDLYGVKKLLVFGLLAYGFGSMSGALLHTSFYGVIAARFIQGAGISAVPALIMVLVARSVSPDHRGKAFGLIGSTVAFGESIGPVIGGIITGYLHWFYLFILPMAALLTLPFFARVLPGEPSKKGKTDMLGAALLSLGMITFTLFASTYRIAFLPVGALLFIGFAVRIRHARSPFIEPSLFGKKTFIGGVLAGGVLLGTVAGYVSMVPYLMKNVYHMPASLIGIGILFPGTVSVILFGLVGGVLADKCGNRFAMIAGIGLLGVSFIAVSLFADRTPWFVTGAVILAFGGLSFVKTAVSAGVAESLGSEEAAAGMSLLSLVCFLAEGIGVAAVGGLLAQHWLAAPFLPTVTDAAAFIYSNMTLVFIAAIVIGGTAFLAVYGRRQSPSANS